MDLGTDFASWFESLSDETTTPSAPALRRPSDAELWQFHDVGDGLLIPEQNLQHFLHGNTLIFDQLSQHAPTSIDLGYMDVAAPPTQSIDIFSLHRGNQFVGLATRPPDQPTSVFYSSLKTQGLDVTPHVAKFNDSVVSSFNQVILAMLTEVCDAPVRPKEVQVTLGADAGLLFSLQGQISVTLDLESNCTELMLLEL